ncbi:MAG: hypothetical protein H8E46_03330 [FCB group bacterium]|nr:hypothetical protein [FCB group bacterium]
MKLLGFIFLLAGGFLLLLYTLYHILIFLISGSPWLLKAGILSLVLGFAFLIISSLKERRLKKDFEEVEE